MSGTPGQGEQREKEPHELLRGLWTEVVQHFSELTLQRVGEAPKFRGSDRAFRGPGHA